MSLQYALGQIRIFTLVAVGIMGRTLNHCNIFGYAEFSLCCSILLLERHVMHDLLRLDICVQGMPAWYSYNIQQFPIAARSKQLNSDNSVERDSYPLRSNLSVLFCSWGRIGGSSDWQALPELVITLSL
jgi:hypothetical protein